MYKNISGRTHTILSILPSLDRAQEIAEVQSTSMKETSGHFILWKYLMGRQINIAI
jgi:hypothetical protein